MNLAIASNFNRLIALSDEELHSLFTDKLEEGRVACFYDDLREDLDVLNAGLQKLLTEYTGFKGPGYWAAVRIQQSRIRVVTLLLHHIESIMNGD